MFTCPSLHEKDSGDWQEVGATQQKFLPTLHRAGGETHRLDDGELLGRTLGWSKAKTGHSVPQLKQFSISITDFQFKTCVHAM